MADRPHRHLRGLLALLAVSILLFTACSSDDRPGVSSRGPVAESWPDVLDEARGETVRLWMWGGEVALNEFIDQDLGTAADQLGITVERVPIDDTASAVDVLLRDAEAGNAVTDIDLLWVNGKNFAQGQQLGLWRADWVSSLPNAALLDADDRTLSTDFGVETHGQEMPWSRAAFVFIHDRETLADPPRSFDELLSFAEDHPGRFTYPAPPDFTGSAFVRLAVQAMGEDEAMLYLQELQPLLWRQGATYPFDQAALDQLFASGEVDLSMSYNPNVVSVSIAQGTFPPTARPFVFDEGSLQNVSFLAIPTAAPAPAAAMVVANLLLSPELQRAKLERVGAPSVLPPALLADAPTPGGSATIAERTGRLGDFGRPLAELPAADVPRIDERWLNEVRS